MMSEPKRDLMRRVHFVRDAEYSERGEGPWGSAERCEGDKEMGQTGKH